MEIKFKGGEPKQLMVYTEEKLPAELLFSVDLTEYPFILLAIRKTKQLDVRFFQYKVKNLGSYQGSYRLWPEASFLVDEDGFLSVTPVTEVNYDDPILIDTSKEEVASDSLLEDLKRFVSSKTGSLAGSIISPMSRPDSTPSPFVGGFTQDYLETLLKER